MKLIKVEIAEPIYVPTGQLAGGEPATSQVFPVILSGLPSVTRKHFVIGASFPYLDKSQRESVASQLPAGGVGSACAFIIHDSEGKATVVTDVGEDRADAFEAAAAVAVVKASCGWDESNPIVVRVDEFTLSVVAQYDGGKWTASVSEAGR